MKTTCNYCAKILQDTKSKNVFAFKGDLYCSALCAISLIRHTGEIVDKESIGINKEVN